MGINESIILSQKARIDYLEKMNMHVADRLEMLDTYDDDEDLRLIGLLRGSDILVTLKPPQTATQTVRTD